MPSSSPRRPINAYIEFCSKVRKELVARGKYTPEEIMVECGRRWKEVHGSPKRELKARAKKRMGAYQQQVAEVKMGTGAYQAFVKANYLVVKTELGANAKNVTVMRELGRRWKARREQVGGGYMPGHKKGHSETKSPNQHWIDSIDELY